MWLCQLHKDNSNLRVHSKPKFVLGTIVGVRGFIGSSLSLRRCAGSNRDHCRPPQPARARVAFWERAANEDTVLQGNEDFGLSAQAEAAWPQTLPVGAYARAALPMQSRLRRLRQDRLPGADPQSAALGSGGPGFG